ncbi:hypothetical protein AB0I91_28620 [Actinosynnema sp. NPDC049800]
MGDEQAKSEKKCSHCGAGTHEERLDRPQAVQTLLFALVRILLWFGLDS